jgi:hypothetical protein
VSDEEEDLEVRAVQRQLDDAFATTRPRRDFEDELWARMQASRPATNRFRDVIAGLMQSIREVPAVPAAAVATLLVVVLGVGLFAYSALGTRPGGSATTALSNGAGGTSRNGDQTSAGGFGLLPSPVFGQGPPATAPEASAANNPKGGEFAGPAQLVWTGRSSIVFTGAPVFRYREPSTNTADQFATALGAVLRGRPQGFLGAYSSSDYTLKVRGTVQSPPSSPAYFIFAGLTMEQVQAAGASQADLANIFLAEHKLDPQWSYTVSVDQSGDPVKVVYERQFEVPGYGLAYLVNSNGARYGLEVDLSNDRPVVVSGMLPMNLDGAYYNLASPADAIQPALNPPPVATVAPLPRIQLTQVDVVYVLVPAGDHSFFEPAYLYSGTMQMNGVTYTKHVLEPAVAPSQRKP